jgi:hypothetical protein
MRVCCRICFRSNVGAARRSTSRCASCVRIPGRDSPNCARACRICCCRCCCVRRMRSATRIIPITSCATSSRRPRRAASTCFASSIVSIGSPNMKVAIDAVRRTDRLCEAAICYTGNLSNPRETKYDLRTTSRSPRSSRRWAPTYSRHQGHGRSLPAARRGQSSSRRSRKKSACRFIFIRTTRAALPRRACSRRSTPAPMRSTARSTPYRG